MFFTGLNHLNGDIIYYLLIIILWGMEISVLLRCSFIFNAAFGILLIGCYHHGFANATAPHTLIAFTAKLFNFLFCYLINWVLLSLFFRHLKKKTTHRQPQFRKKQFLKCYWVTTFWVVLKQVPEKPQRLLFLFYNY